MNDWYRGVVLSTPHWAGCVLLIVSLKEGLLLVQKVVLVLRSYY